MYKEWDYYTWNVAIPANEIKNINSVIEKNYSVDEDKNIVPPGKNLSKVKLIRYGHIAPLIGNFIDIAHMISTTGFGYNIFPVYNNSIIHYSIYDSKDKADYGWHRDTSGTPITDTKLTLLINLSEEEYEGGNFQVLTGNEPITIDEYGKPGSAVIFKSHILHRVLPVTSGIRKSLAIFLEGPRFQ